MIGKQLRRGRFFNKRKLGKPKTSFGKPADTGSRQSCNCDKVALRHPNLVSQEFAGYFVSRHPLFTSNDGFMMLKRVARAIYRFAMALCRALFAWCRLRHRRQKTTHLLQTQYPNGQLLTGHSEKQPEIVVARVLRLFFSAMRDCHSAESGAKSKDTDCVQARFVLTI